MEVKVKMVLMSHMNDCMIDKKNYHLEFCKYILFNFPDTNVEIDADKVWKQFVDFCEKNGQEIIF